MNERFPNLSQAFNFRRTDVVKTIALLAGPFNDSNINRIYHKTFKVKCPFTGNRQPVNFFYRHNSGPLPDDISSCPPCANLNQDSAALAIVAHTTSIPGFCPPFDISHNDKDRRQGGGQGSDNERDERNDGGCLGGREIGDVEMHMDGDVGRGSKFTKEGNANARVDINSSNEVRSIYWESMEAANLFGFEYGDDVYVGVQKRIQLLSDALNLYDGYKHIVEGEGEGLSEYQVFNIRNKSLYRRCAYDIALKRLGKDTLNWTMGCCKEAVLKANEMGIQATTSARTVQNWNVNYRKFANSLTPIQRLQMA
jgi:hypothetical protein